MVVADGGQCVRSAKRYFVPRLKAPLVEKPREIFLQIVLMSEFKIQTEGECVEYTCGF